MKYLYISLFTLLFSQASFAKLNILTTTTNLKSLVEYIGGDLVNVESFSKGTQDPHFLEAKPSYTFKLAKADLLVSVGADLEIGWLPLIVRGSRNPKLRVSSKGRLEAANAVELIKEHQGPISRSQGDVHPEGNPHLMLGPSKSIKVAESILTKLSELDQANTSTYQQNFKKFKAKMTKLILKIRKQIRPGMKIVTYHRTLSYFLEEFGIETVEVLEPKPGIPPTASHIINVIKLMKNKKIDRIIVENYFDTNVAMRIKKSIPGTKVFSVPVAVGGDRDIKDLYGLYENLTKAMVK